MEEIWKPVIEYEGLYEVSSFGRIKSFHSWKEKILLPSKSRWYSNITFYNKLKLYSIWLHRLVAIHFIPNPNNLPLVCHKDEKLTNWSLYNWLDNLYWWTHKDNSQDRNRKWRANNNFQLNHPKPTLWKLWKDSATSRLVYQYTPDWNFIKKWYCIRDVERELWIKNPNISACCRWKYNQSWWFIWKYSLDLGETN